jgi:cysteine desulfurase/selenocysteine lyase
MEKSTKAQNRDIKEEKASSDVRTAVLDPEKLKQDFPILKRRIKDRRLVYLDSAATTQKPQSVIDAVSDYYSQYNANVHRGLHTLAEEATSLFEDARHKTARFIGASKKTELIYTRNATEAINLVAQTWGRQNIGPGDNIVTTRMEHHANLVPWIMLAKETGAKLNYIEVDENGLLDLSNLDEIITSNTKLVAVTHMSNLLGTINPVEELAKKAHEKGAVILIDGAQAVPHLPVDIQTIDADFYAFSAHKMLGPTGIGFLYGKEKILDLMPPYMYGGEMISEVRYDHAGWNELPWKFEAGTPNIAGAAGFASALEYLENIGMDAVRRHEKELTEYAMISLNELGFIQIFGPKNVELRGGAISFNDKDIHPHDAATFLDSRGIAVRAGHHCAQPMTKRLGVNSTVRASLYIYNTHEDIDELIIALIEMRRFFGYG